MQSTAVRDYEHDRLNESTTSECLSLEDDSTPRAPPTSSQATPIRPSVRALRNERTDYSKAEAPQVAEPAMGKDYCSRCGATTCQNATTRPRTPRKTDIVYKDCVIIGNGPSAIGLSYFLSGNWPYYDGATLADEYLQLRLNDQPHESLVTQDLEYLSDGVEGRSPNPVAVLYDMLSHPNADVGVQTPPALRWKLHTEEKIDHVVLGKGRPGGVWRRLDRTVNTLSISHWMELPNLPFKQWLNDRTFRKPPCDLASPIHDRATIDDVRDYYSDYIVRQRLHDNFLDDHVVTSVQKVVDNDAEVDCDSGECRITAECRQSVCWEVCGRQKDLNSNDVFDFCYRTRNVVLAVGSHDQPNRLGVPGEHLPYVMHSLQEFQEKIRGGELSDDKPVVIVGAGLSVGDAIAVAENAGLGIAHVFRRRARDPEIVFRQLPTVQYPEYHQIYQLMTGERVCDHYQPYEEHLVGEFLPDGQVMVYERNDPHRTPKIIQTSAALVLIGSKPDLSFMPKGGKTLGVVPRRKVDSKSNPMDVNPYTYESNVEPGLFALGALVGDNFVRFLQGGCLAICKRLITNRVKSRDASQ